MIQRGKLRSALAESLAVVALALMLASTSDSATKYKVLHNFGVGSDASFPKAALVLDKKGNLYGTAGGGVQGVGTVFELRPRPGGKWAEKVLHSFDFQNDGSDPTGGVVFDTAGNLYGTTAGGGAHDLGTVFKLAAGISGWTASVLYEGGSKVGLVTDKAGDLFGMIGPSKYGDGAVAELSPGSDGWTLNTLYSFCSRYLCPDGEGPRAPLSWDAAGNLFGTTFYGGNNYPKCFGSLGCGVAFEMTPNSNGTWKYYVLHRFAAFPTDGEYPIGGLVLDGSGNVYGTASFGGPRDSGTVFKMTPSSNGHWKQTVLYDFPNCSDGCGPDTTLVFDKAGNLYGTGGGGLTACGGYYCGVVFKLTPQASGKWKYSVLHRFNGQDGAGPNGVIVDGKGNVFGTTLAGGPHNVGVAFEITP